MTSEQLIIALCLILGISLTWILLPRYLEEFEGRAPFIGKLPGADVIDRIDRGETLDQIWKATRQPIAIAGNGNVLRRGDVDDVIAKLDPASDAARLLAYMAEELEQSFKCDFGSFDAGEGKIVLNGIEIDEILSLPMADVASIRMDHPNLIIETHGIDTRAQSGATMPDSDIDGSGDAAVGNSGNVVGDWMKAFFAEIERQVDANPHPQDLYIADETPSMVKLDGWIDILSLIVALRRAGALESETPEHVWRHPRFVNDESGFAEIVSVPIATLETVAAEWQATKIMGEISGDSDEEDDASE